MSFDYHKFLSKKKTTETATDSYEQPHNERESYTISISDDNIDVLRGIYPNGLHFIVGDTHGEPETLKLLMDKIKFDPVKDHIFFVGDYNAGSDVVGLIGYLSKYFQPDYTLPGFHLIRGNHERELYPMYYLDNLPDIVVLRGNRLNYFIAHAGVVGEGFRKILCDIEATPDKKVFAYKLDDSAAGYDCPLRQFTWSRGGLYSQHSHLRVWPSTDELKNARMCIMHGHTPFCFLKKDPFILYGDKNLFWSDQHIIFSEDLQSFNLDSNVKGRYDPSDPYRGLSCVCIEGIEEAAQDKDLLTISAIKAKRNFAFGVRYTPSWSASGWNESSKLLNAHIEFKTIYVDLNGEINII